MTRLAEVVSEQHRYILELVDALASERRRAERERIAHRLAEAWSAHARAEERVLYAPRSIELEEHAMIEFMLARVVANAPHATTQARIRLLRELLVRHQDLEERVRLPATVLDMKAREETRIATALANAFTKLAPIKRRASKASRAARAPSSRRRGEAPGKGARDRSRR